MKKGIPYITTESAVRCIYHLFYPSPCTEEKNNTYLSENVDLRCLRDESAHQYASDTPLSLV